MDYEIKTLDQALETLGLKNSTNDADFEIMFDKNYKHYLLAHKESNFKFVKDQNELDDIVMSSVLNLKQFSVCAYCRTIYPIEIPMGSNGYRKCSAC